MPQQLLGVIRQLISVLPFICSQPFWHNSSNKCCPTPAYCCASNYHPTPPTPGVRQRVPWNLLKTLIPDKLDIDNCTTEQHKSWKRGFQQFASDADSLSCPWSDQYMALRNPPFYLHLRKLIPDASNYQLINNNNRTMS